jgi:zinc/manganese transport system permease protein
MFSGFMVDTWLVASMAAVIAGLIGFFVVLRGAAFVAHAVPNGAFAGAAGAGLLGVNVLFGLGAFSLLGALTINWLSRRGRQDVATALTLVLLLGIGALFLSFTAGFAPAAYSLLFGEILGVANNQLLPTALLATGCVALIALLYRPLLLSTVLGEAGEARGIRGRRLDLLFLIAVAAATTMSVPVVGTTLIFSLMIGAPAAAAILAKRPGGALALSVAIALATVWLAIALAWLWDLPVGFFVGVLSALVYALARGLARARARPNLRGSAG